TLVLICNIRDPVTGQSYSRDCRHVAQKAETYLRSTGIGDTAYFGPELEHFVFNEVRYDQGTNFGYYEINAAEANWDSGKAKSVGLGHKLRPKEGYFPGPPRRSPAGRPHGNGDDARTARHCHRGASSRSRDGRPGRDRHAFRHADSHG